MADKVRADRGTDGLLVDDGGVITVKSGGRVHVESGGKITEAAGGLVLGRSTFNTYSADIGTAGSSYVVCPFAGTVVGLAVVNHSANAGTKTVLTAKINGATITHPTFEVAVTAAAGVGVSVVPTAANTVAAGDVLEMAYDGGSNVVTPASFTFTVLRSS